jgi:hypothetical protein
MFLGRCCATLPQFLLSAEPVSHSTMQPRRETFDWAGLALALILMALFGWAAAGTPFRGDHALFTEYARRMNGGAILYRDLWEVTNPGVFWFYQLAGTCFGFTEDGIHLFEWLYWAAFVQTVAFATKRAHALARWPLAPAVLIGGMYYLTSCSDPAHPTKAEGLVAFPLFLSAWLAWLAVDRARPSLPLLFLAGLSGGLAVLLKFAFGICLLGGWLPALVVAYRRLGIRTVFVALLAMPAGLAAVLMAAAGFFAAHGALEIALHSVFVAPREIVEHAELAGWDRLAFSVRWFVEVYSPVLALAVAGTFTCLSRRVDPLVVSLGLMFVVAVPVLLVQRWSWWTYHFLLLAEPASVLAAFTWPTILAEVRGRLQRPFTRIERMAAVVVCLTLFLPALGHGTHAYYRLFTHRLGFSVADRQAARQTAGRAYAAATEETAWLAEPDAKPGAIFVFGDPLFHWQSGRVYATRTHGWAIELFTPKLWAMLFQELQEARPVYLFIDVEVQHYDRLILKRCPELIGWLKQDYIEVRRSGAGVWYERR